MSTGLAPSATGPNFPAIAFCISGNLLLRLANAATGGLMGLLLASINRERGDVPAIAIGLLAASFYVSELLGAPWCGAMSDRWGRRPFMIAGPICGGIAVQLIGWPSLFIGWPLLLVAMAAGRVIEGLSTATSAPTTLSYLSAETVGSPDIRGRVMAWYEMATVVGIGAGFGAAGVLWSRFDHSAFAMVSIIYALSLLAFLAVRDGGRAGGMHHPGRQALFEVLRRPRIFRFIPAWLFVNTVLGLWFTHSAFQLTGVPHPGQALSGGLTPMGLTFAFAYVSAAFMLGVFLWGFVVGRYPKTSVMLGTLVGIYVVGAALVGLNHPELAGSVPGWMVMAVLLLGVAVASGFTPAALAYLADVSEEMPTHRGAVMGMYSVVLGLGQLAGGALGGPFADAGGVDGLILLTVLLGSAAVLTVLGLRSFDRRPLPRSA
jgi:MFS family permease